MSNPEKELSVGVARLTYRKDGSIRTANFEPTIFIDEKAIRNCINKCTGNKTISTIQTTAEFMLGAFFSKLTEIELADREKYAIKSRLLYASNYMTKENKPFGIKEVAMQFYFTEI